MFFEHKLSQIIHSLQKFQTTYENFRYRYDKKENPYNKGIFKNIREVFFSKMPPALNNFRSWVTEETQEMVPVTPHTAAAINNVATKEKLDIEMGYKRGIDPNMAHMPAILQGLDYSAIENNLNLKGREGDSPQSLFFPITLPRDNLENQESHEGCKREQQSVSFHVEVEEKVPHQNHAAQ
jgi:palmitoyltransferase ZDHHC9/14/18